MANIINPCGRIALKPVHIYFLIISVFGDFVFWRKIAREYRSS